MDNKNFCEQVEIAIYSDTELSQEQKNHIENCESCRALLSQINSIKKELGVLEYSGISEGKIADAVMSEIRDRKLSAAFPKFKITHHLGTAAAIVIILAAALMIKNPSETKNFDANDKENGAKIVYDTKNNNHVLRGANEPLAQEVIEESVTQNTALGAEITEYNDTVNGTAERTLLLKSAKTQSVPTSVAEDDKESVQAQADMDEGTTNDSAVLMLSKSPESAEQSTAETAYLTSDEMPSLEESYTEEEIFADADDAVIKYTAAQEKYIFEGIDFKSGDENFDYNISLANQRLYELFGEGYVLSKEKLIALNVNNAKFSNYAPKITERMFNLYKNVFDIFE